MVFKNRGNNPYVTEKDIDKDTSVILDTRGPACQPCSADPTGRGPALCQPAPGQEKQFWLLYSSVQEFN